jgi:predicted site-specific integrase-resolvase
MEIIKETVYYTQSGVRCYSRQDVAKICGISIQTLKLWEDAKVIPEPIRDDNNYRYWDEPSLELIKEYANQSRKDRYGLVKGKNE